MSFVRDWDTMGPLFETEDEAYDDFLENLYLYIEDVLDEFTARVSLSSLLEWAVQQESFQKNFGDDYDIALRHAFEENYPEHDDDDE